MTLEEEYEDAKLKLIDASYQLIEDPEYYSEYKKIKDNFMRLALKRNETPIS